MRLKDRVNALQKQLSDQQPPKSVGLPSDFDFNADFQEFMENLPPKPTPEQEYAALCAMKPPVWRRSRHPSAEALIYNFFQERKRQLERDFDFSEES